MGLNDKPYAWHEPDGCKLPPGRVALALVRYPFIAGSEWFSWYSWTSDWADEDSFIIREYCGVWGKVYYGVIIGGMILCAIYYAFRHR